MWQQKKRKRYVWFLVLVHIFTCLLITDADAEKSNLKQPEFIHKDSYAPMNHLQIKDNMEGADVTVLDYGEGVAKDGNYAQIKSIEAWGETDGNEDYVDKSISQGNFWSNDTGNSVGIYNSMYKSMRGGEGDQHYGGMSILFQGSSKDYVYGNYEWDGYEWEYEEGWKQEDRSIDTTTMWISLKYDNVGYFKGKKIDAFAKIKLTPSKNRNPSAPWDNDAYGYRGTYEPMIQVSKSLYRGWVWQNVKEFHVDLQFCYSGTTTPIALVENQSEQNYNSLNASYYVINSLNPVTDSSSWERYPHYIGPEYILPTQENGIASAYIVDEYYVDGKSYESNIQTEYVVGNNTFYAYNGGTNDWGEAEDVIGASGWAQNSVMIMPNECDTLSFTLGQLEREPYDEGHVSKKHTSTMWATISTTPFSKERTPVNIPVVKEWNDVSQTEIDTVESVTFELYLEGTTSEGLDYKEKQREITVSENNGTWMGIFAGVEILESDSFGAVYDRKYVIYETKIVYKDGTVVNVPQKRYEVTYFNTDAQGNITEGSSIFSTTLTENQISENGFYQIKESFTVKNKAYPKGSITILKEDEKGNRLNNVTFLLKKAKVENGIWTEDAEDEGQIKITGNENGEDGKCVFEELDAGNYMILEIKSAQGHQLLKEPIRVTLPYTDGEQERYDLIYTVFNGQQFDLPLTGTESGKDSIFRLGVAVVIVAGILLLWGKPQKIIKAKRRKA